MLLTRVHLWQAFTRASHTHHAVSALFTRSMLITYTPCSNRLCKSATQKLDFPSAKATLKDLLTMLSMTTSWGDIFQAEEWWEESHKAQITICTDTSCHDCFLKTDYFCFVSTCFQGQLKHIQGLFTFRCDCIWACTALRETCMDSGDRASNFSECYTPILASSKQEGE